MPTPDEEFIRRLRATFKVEAEEHLQTISSKLLELEKSSAPAPAAIETTYREAHSLKGAARAVDFTDVEAICQAMETVLSGWKRQPIVPTAQACDVLHRVVDAIHDMLRTIDSVVPASATNGAPLRDQLIESLLSLESAQPVSIPLLPPPQIAVLRHEPVEGACAPMADTVRIPISKLDERLRKAEDMLSVKSIIVRRAEDLQAATGTFEQWEREWTRVAGEDRRPGAIDDFAIWNRDFIRSLQSRLLSLAAQARRDCHSIGQRVDDLLEDSKKLIMLPFATVAGGFPKLVRDLCRDQNKEAELVIRGGEVEIDKRILEEMKDPLNHILRNAVDHGIELPAHRARLNKNSRAAITLTVRPVNGNKVEISVSDDGGGVDVERVKASAVRHNILSEDRARQLADDDALDLIFQSEVSTSPIVTTISGRGLGMAIVRAKAEKLGGSVHVESVPQVGTTIRIILPLTLATFRGILVSAGKQTFVVPTLNVERLLRVKQQDIRMIENRETIAVSGESVSLARLVDVLELSVAPALRGFEQASWPVMILRSGAQRIAFVTDEILGEEEVLVKPLRKPLVRVRNISGATILGSGKSVPILHVGDLLQSAAAHGAPPTPVAKPVSKVEAKGKKILVVEDSITSRMLLKGILESAGYQVQTAVDGVDAFTALRESDFDLLVSDVEMPRMNGFDLTSKVRADKRIGNLPVVLVTALESREERERGIDAGASAYIIKSRFDQSNLLEVVRRLA